MAMLVTVGVCSCRNVSDDRGGVGFVYTVDLDNSAPLDRLAISEFCDSVATIIVETHDGALLSQIRKLVYADDRIYILNGMGTRTMSLAEFDMSGNFVRRYGRVGRGPGEYVSVFDFTLDGERAYLLDIMTRRIISYDLDSGRYLEDIPLSQTASTYRILKTGDTFYTDLHDRVFDESNYMLQSWKNADVENKKYHLPVGEYLQGWTNTTSVGGVSFVDGVDGHHLFTHELSNEILKLYTDSIGKYIYLKSADFIGPKERRAISESINSQPRNTSGPSMTEHSRPTDFDTYWGVRDYFETNRYICFSVFKNGLPPTVLYDKQTGTSKRTHPTYIDLIVKDGYPEVSACLTLLHADENGLFYTVIPHRMELFRAAAADGQLNDDLDKLELLKKLSDDANPVVFFLKFK